MKTAVPTLLLAALLSACAPLTQVQDVTPQSDATPRALETLMLIGVTGDDAVRRAYEAKCSDSLDAAAGGYPKRMIQSHEVFPDGDSLTRENVIRWLDSNDQVDGILVLQLAALTSQAGSLNPGGTVERFGVNLYQPGLTWNYQADPSEQLPDHQSALSQATLYVRPEQQIALTIMTSTNVDQNIGRMAESHCGELRKVLLEQGWL